MGFSFALSGFGHGFGLNWLYEHAVLKWSNGHVAMSPGMAIYSPIDSFGIERSHDTTHSKN
jgi:hypothetical protein